MQSRAFATGMLAAAALWVSGAPVIVSGGGRDVIRVDDGAEAGLSGVFVAYTCSGVHAETDDAGAVWSRFDSRGSAYGEVIGTGRRSPELDAGGFSCESGGRTEYFWLVDYSIVAYAVTALLPEETDCSSVSLAVEGGCPEMAAYGPSGRRVIVDRGITLEYETLEAREGGFARTRESRSLQSVGSRVSAGASLCTTSYVMSGDRFLRAWGDGTEVESGPVSPRAVEGIVEAVEQKRDAANEQKGNEQEGVFGGSGPVVIDFSAQVSDGAVFSEWQFSGDRDFEDITYRESSLDFTRTFNETGTEYVRFVCANPEGTCEWVSETMSVSVGESRLSCPNAFSPGASEGVNDEWRVSYRSIVEFECQIFNRLGVRLAVLRDPSQGWDGRYKGKLVKPGAYYYVIKARGADGKVYHLAGDINIVGG